MRLALALCLVSSVAFGDQLAKGRKLANQKQYKQAIAAFEEGLKTAPDDPTLLGEAGFAAFLDKDYDKAETLTRKSLNRQATPGVRGATLYNLGQIREAKGDKAGAIAAYKESVKARPHRVVRAALAKLDPAAAAAADELVPAKLSGPHKELAAFCAIPTPDDECSCGKPTDVAGKLVAPFDKLQAFERSCSEGSSHEHVVHLIAAKLPTGWYVFQASDNINTLKCEDRTAFGAATVVGATLHVPIDQTGSCITGTETSVDEARWSEHGELVLGVGPSKIPAASAVITTHEETGSGSSVSLALKVEWKSPTEFTLAGKVKGIDKPDLLGPHTLVFP